MPLNRKAAIERLQLFDFPALFTQELGWDWYTAETKITANKADFTLKGVAEKRGVHVFHCLPGPDGQIPDAGTLSAIERQVVKLAREHLLIFTDADNIEQVWIYPRREPGKPIRLIRYRFDPAKANELLLQKLTAITFTLNEEEGLNLLGVVERLKDALDRDTVSKKFYQRFEKERAAFQVFLRGIPGDEMQRWYVAVMMNRLMFIYFIQEKGFLGGGDSRYLQKHLDGWKGNFYSDFLCPLFFEGFALQEADRSEKTRKLLGQVPYLNGGIFEKHEIETAHGKKIDIPNDAFTRLFAFFDEWRWHLDERPIADGREINPEILGYIFEKFINQKQMGAYYTKEDITGYISRNTIIPYVLDSARKNCKVAFEGGKGDAGILPAVWNLLQNDPDRYIYPAVRKGMEHDLPKNIAAGVKDVSKRADWNKPAPSEHALPTEIWRETVARRQRCEELRKKLANGEVREINDLITYTLDIEQFAQDVVQNCEGPDLLRAVWNAVSNISVLDPTCGSGAFLFAALNILEPLYEASLDRMDALLADAASKHDRAKLKTTPNGYPLLPHKKFEDFSMLLDRVADHTNRRYFIIKHIILNNLYGVDIMKEAVEICKLRLFLKLAAQVEPDPAKPNLGIEPLPDIDFNIRAGNTLVGFATYDEVKKVAATTLDFDNAVAKIDDKAAILDSAFDQFRKQQTELGGEVTAEDKQALRERLEDLEAELNRYLAADYGISPDNPKKYAAWLESHKPFHWFVEFYGIMKRGGFEVIIGNPPYVEYETVSCEYTVQGYRTEPCGNLYAFIWERCLEISTTRGRIGMIVPVASVCTEGYSSLQGLLRDSGSTIVSNFNDRPGKLFDGLEHIRLSIILSYKEPRESNSTFSTGYIKWQTVQRPSLFERLAFVNTTPTNRVGSMAKFGSSIESSLLEKVSNERGPLARYASGGAFKIYYTRKLSYFVQILDFIPSITDSRGKSRMPSELKQIPFEDKPSRDVFLGILNSSLFYWLLTVYSDCRNLNKREINLARFDIPKADEALVADLCRATELLMEDIRKKSQIVPMKYKKYGLLKIQCTFPKHSKPIIDEIDRVLARHYGFTDEELDFIINYDIKYRMGLGGGSEAEE